ncbi:MAG: 50S ribosomal protein L24 [Desulfomonilaceae bacterium]|nr:50S ribosomal protein L24 [Syntrophaceae bacterium]
MSNIKKNDRVRVLSGKNKGKEGKVLKVNREKDTAVVERVNIVKRHTKAGSGAGKQGGIIDKEAPIQLSKLILVCPKCSKPSKIGIKTLDDGDRVRFCKKCLEQLES